MQRKVLDGIRVGSEQWIFDGFMAQAITGGPVAIDLGSCKLMVITDCYSDRAQVVRNVENTDKSLFSAHRNGETIEPGATYFDQRQ